MFDRLRVTKNLACKLDSGRPGGLEFEVPMRATAGDGFHPTIPLRRQNESVMESTTIRLWKKTTKSGKDYLTGSMSRVSRLIVVENDGKKEDDEPDYFAYIVPNRGSGQEAEQVDRL